MWEPINPHKNVMLVCLFTQLVITALHEKQDRWREHAHLLTHKRLGRPTKRARYFQSNKNTWLTCMFCCWLKRMAKFQKIICLTLQAGTDEFGSRWPRHLLKQLLTKNFLQPWYMYSIFTVAHSKRSIWEIWITWTFFPASSPQISTKLVITKNHSPSSYNYCVQFTSWQSCM